MNYILELWILEILRYGFSRQLAVLGQISPTGTQYYLMLMEKGRLKQLENARVVFPGKYFTVIHLGFGVGVGVGGVRHIREGCLFLSWLQRRRMLRVWLER
jgi:hypothetical protein